MTTALVDLGVEREVLASLLFHGREAWLRVSRILPGVGEFSPGHRPAFRCLRELAERGVSADLDAIRQTALRLGENQFAEDVSTPLDDIAEHFGRLDAVEHHAAVLADLASRRALLLAADGLRVRALDATTPLALTIGDAVTAISSQQRTATFPGRNDGMFEVLQELERETQLNGELPGIASGIPDLDNATDGWCPGRLVVLAARPKMGKSSLALSFAHEAAVRNDVETYFVTLEQPTKQMRRRQIAMHTGLDLRALRTSEMWRRHAATVTKAANDLLMARLTFDAHTNTPAGLRLALQRHAVAEQPAALVIVDQLSWFRADTKEERHDLSLGAITRELARLAKDFACCVILVVQINRGVVESGKTRRPRISDLRDSGRIEEDADQILLLWEPPVEGAPDSGDETVIELLLDANRHGPTRNVRVEWKKSTFHYAQAFRPRAVA